MRIWIWRGWILAAALGCGAVRPAPPPVPGMDGLDRRVDALSRQLAPRGLSLVSTTRRFFSEGEAHNVRVDLTRGCATMIIRASGRLEDVDLTVYSPTGERIAEDTEPDAEAAVQWCASAHETHAYVRVLSYAGAGEAAILVFRSAEPRPVDREVAGRRVRVIGAHPTSDEVTTSVRRRGFEQRGDAIRFEVPPAPRGLGTMIVPTTSTGGQCHAVIAVGSVPVALDVASVDGEPIAREAAGPRTTAAQWCADEDASVNIRITAPGGTPVRVTIFDVPQDRIGGRAGLWLGQQVNP